MSFAKHKKASLWQQMSEFVCGRSFATFLSAVLLLATVLAGATLFRGSPLDGLASAYIISAHPMRLDASVYHYDGKTYARAGRVVASGGTRHRLELIREVARFDGSLVAAITPANIGQFVKLQSPEDLAAMRADVTKLVNAIVGEVFTILRNPHRSSASLNKLQIAFLETLENSELESSRSELSALLQNKVSPRLSHELRALLFDRIKTAMHIIIDDAMENYGTDLVRGRFETSPIVHAVDGLLADPRMLDLVAGMLSELLNEPKVAEATHLFATQYVERLFETFLKQPSSPNKIANPHAEMMVRYSLKFIGDQIYRNEAAHPVVVAVVANVMKPESPRSDAILVLTSKPVAAKWSAVDNVVPVQAGR